MAANELLKTLYTQFYAQRELLSEAPPLTQDPEGATFDLQKAEEEINALISYLMSVPDIQQVEFDKAVEIIQTYYSDQPEWKALLVNYLEYINEKEKEKLQAQEAVLIREIEEFTDKLLAEKETSDGSA